jgi:hypothetical protein
MWKIQLMKLKFDGRETFSVEALREKGSWDKQAILDLFFDLLPKFAHKETGKYLDQRM